MLLGSQEEIKWEALIPNASDGNYLPTMRTDVTLRSPKRTIVLDTKYYKSTLANRYDKKRV